MSAECLVSAQDESPPAQDPARLAHPQVVASLELEESQITAIQELLDQRAVELASAEPGERAAIIERINQALLATLTEEQRAKFDELGQQQPIRFTFSDQKWDEVLTWFADQAELSLIMDQVPEGEFSYSGTRGYSPSEGLDLLNSVLMTKGVTLVRRNRMLIVLQLSEQMPLDLIPRVTLDELGERGRFEFVSVMFPLASRPIDAVVAEVTPYLGTYGRAVPLATSRQLLVVETAGKMEAINLLIASVPEPTPPTPTPPPEKPPSPVFASYPLGLLDPDATLETIKTLIGSESITVDAQTKLLTAYVIPGQQTAIKSAIDQLIAQAVDQGDATTKAYRLQTSDPEAVLTQLTEIAPDASASYDASLGRFIVYAIPGDQEKISQMLEALGGNDSAVGEGWEVSVYDVEQGNVAELGEIVSQMLPNAQVVTNETLQRIVIRGVATDQLQVTQLLEQWRANRNEKKTIRVYEFDDRVPSELISNLGSLIPESNLIQAEDTHRATLIGSDADHQLVADTIQEYLDALPPEAPRTLKVYDLNTPIRTRWGLVRTTLDDALEGAELIDDETNGELLVLATDAQHQLIAASLEQLEQSDATSQLDLELVLYPLTVEDVDTVQEMFAEEFPTTKSLYDENKRTLLVWAKEEAQQDVAGFLEQLQTALPARRLRSVETYPLQGWSVEQLQTWVTDVAPAATLTSDPTRDRVIVFGYEEEHTAIASLIQNLEGDAANRNERVARFYDVDPSDVEAVQTLLSTLLVDASVTWDDSRKQLIVVAREMEQATVDSLLLETAESRPEIAEAKLRPFQLDAKALQRFESLRASIEADYPDASFVADADGAGLLVWAPDSEMDAIAELINEIDSLDATSERAILIAYPLRAADPSVIQQSLLEVLPDLSLAVDESTRSLIVIAPLAQQATVKSLIDQIDSIPAASGEEELKSYDLDELNAAQVAEMLEAMRNGITVNADSDAGRILVSGNASDHLWVAETLRTINEGPSDDPRTLQSYEAENTNLQTLPGVLNQLAPTAIITADDVAQKILVWGTEQDQAQIAEAVKQLAKTSGDTNELELYAVEPERASFVLSTLQTMYPELSFSLDPEEIHVVVWANEMDQARVAQSIERILESTGPVEGEQVLLYEIKVGQISEFEAALASQVPAARIIAGQGTPRLIIAGNQRTQQEISALFEKLHNILGEVAEVELQTHQVRGDLKATAQQMITSQYPEVEIINSGFPDRLLARASPERHQQIKAMVDELVASVKPQPARQVVSLGMEGMDKSLAQQVLANRLPNLEFIPTEDLNQLVVWAPQPEVDRARQILAELQATAPKPTPLTTEVYPVDAQRITADSVVESIDPTLKENVTLQVNAASNSIIATANATQHSQLKAAIETLVEKLPAAASMEARVYHFENSDPEAAVTPLQTLFPNASLGVDSTGNSIAITALVKEHEQIQRVIEELDRLPTEEEASTVVYRMSQGDPSALVAVLSQLLPEASIQADSTAKAVVATATLEQHERIKSVIDQYGGMADESNSIQVYGLNRASPFSVRDAIAGAIPDALVIPDESTQSLIVTASEEDHALVEQVIQQMEEVDPREPELIVYRLEHIDAVEAYPLVSQAIPLSTDTGVSYDERSQSLMVVAPRSKHDLVAKIIEQVDRPRTEARTREAKVLTLVNADGGSIAEALESLFESDADPLTVTFDDRSKQLIVVGTEEQLRIAEATVAQFQVPERKFRVFSLERNDSRSVEGAMRGLFDDQAQHLRPQINSNHENSQIFVRATEEQMKTIETLLIQLGESTESAITTSQNRVRSFQNSPAFLRALDEVQRVWPSVRQNKIQVLGEESGDQPGINVRESGELEQGELRRVEPDRSGNSDSEPDQNPNNEQANQKGTSSRRTTLESHDNFRWVTVQRNGNVVVDPTQDEPPIIVIPGAGKTTIASDDIEALNQFERLLRMALDRGGATTVIGNLSVYLLKNAGAVQVQELITSLFDGIGRPDGFMGNVMVVADERINAIVVYANRNDRRLIDELVAVLDSDDLVDSLVVTLPRLIPVKHTDASRIYEICETVYRAQLATSGGGRRLSIPEGVSSDVASILQQINASASMPILTLGVDDVSNSLIVRAPVELAQEVASFVETLDTQAADESSKSIHIISLEHSRADQIREALEMFLRNR